MCLTVLALVFLLNLGAFPELPELQDRPSTVSREVREP